MSIASLIQSEVDEMVADPERVKRLRHLVAAMLLVGGDLTAAEVAAVFGISRRTLYNWRDRALTYADPEADGLRRLAGRRR